MVYSGNLIEWRRACGQLRSIGLHLEFDSWVNEKNRTKEEAIRIKTDSGAVIVAKVFSHWDEDVLCNEQTAWLTRCYNDLKGWK